MADSQDGLSRCKRIHLMCDIVLDNAIKNSDGLSRQEWSDGKENKQDDNMPQDELDDNTNLEEKGHSDGGGGARASPCHPCWAGRDARLNLSIPSIA